VRVFLARISRTIQIGLVVIAITISIFSLSTSRLIEIAARDLGLSQPFPELRQKVYVDAIQSGSSFKSRNLLLRRAGCGKAELQAALCN
jgi:hypothetical protein